MPEGFKLISDTKFQIPASSFTAFKLTYTDIAHVLETSKCILLGGIPKGWYDRNIKREGLKSTYERFGAKITSRNSSPTENIQNSKIERRAVGLYNIFQDDDNELPYNYDDDATDDDLWLDSDTESSEDIPSLDDLNSSTVGGSLEMFQPEPIKHDTLKVPYFNNINEEKGDQNTKDILGPKKRKSIRSFRINNTRNNQPFNIDKINPQSLSEESSRHFYSNQHRQSNNVLGMKKPPKTKSILKNKDEIPIVVTNPETGSKTQVALALRKDDKNTSEDMKPKLIVPDEDTANSLMDDIESFQTAERYAPSVRFNPEINQRSVANSKRSSIAVVDHNPVDDPDLVQRKVKFEKDLYHLLHRLRKSSSRISRKQKTATKKFV